jgi:hypothetical protein
VWQIDTKTGERLKQYASISDAADAMPFPHPGANPQRGTRISKAIKRSWLAFGFKWEYVEPADKDTSASHVDISVRKAGTHRAIWKLDKETGRRLERYESLKEASKSLSGRVHASKLSKACRGHVPDAYGFRWEYANDDDTGDEDKRVDASGSEPDPRKEVATRVLQQLVDCGAMMPTLFEPLQEIIYSEMKHPYLKDQQEFVLGHAKTFQCGNVQDLGNAIMWKDDLIFHAMTLKEYECANMKKNLELQKNVSNEMFTSLREHICKTLPADILAEVGTKETGFKEFILTVIIAIAKKCTEAERFADHTEQKLKSVTEERNALASARENYTEFARMISRDKEELVKFHDALYQVRIDETEKEMREAQRAVDASAEKLQELKRKRVSIEDSL